MRGGSAAEGGGRGRGAPGPACSLSPRRGQWRAALLAGALLSGAPALAACHKAAPASEAAAQPGGRETPSGLAVPRYVATKFETVNARSGPGDDYPLVWTYRARGLPLQVTAETQEWRRVCDPDGQTAWVHRRTVAETARVMRVAATPLPLRARPAETARATAELAARATASLGACKDGWCRVTADKTSGWAPAGELWGTSPAKQCVAKL